MADAKLEATNAEEALDAGFIGSVLDPTPNHAYTVEGVGAGEPTPETDPKAKEAAQARIAELEGKFSRAEEAAPAPKSTKSSASS